MRGMKWHHLGKKITEKYPKGQGMVEFALILPLLLVLMFGVIEFGRMLFTYSVVFSASREAARYGSASGDNGSGVLRYADCDGIQEAARRIGVLANITSIDIGYDNGPGTTLATGCPPSIDIEGGRARISVEVNAIYQPIVPLLNLSNANIRAQSARTIFAKIEVGRFPKNPIYVKSLTGSSTPGSNTNKFNAHATVTVYNEEGTPIDGVTVVGLWSSGNPPTDSCTPIGSGVYSCNRLDLPNNKSPVRFEVVDLLHADHGYDPTLNTASAVNIFAP